MSEDYNLIRTLGENDARVLEEKGKTYGDSWRKRGGVGAFMMLSRKWDRIENISKEAGYDIFAAGRDNTGDIMDDIQDLRRYLLLVEAFLYDGSDEKEEGDCGPGYVNQDPDLKKERSAEIPDHTHTYHCRLCGQYHGLGFNCPYALLPGQPYV